MAKVKRKSVPDRWLYLPSVAAAYGHLTLSPHVRACCSSCSGVAHDIIEEMPSPVGHVLAGIAVGSFARRDGGWTVPLACGVAAALPDIDFLLPIAHRGPTHSLIAGVAAFGLIVLGMRLMKVPTETGHARIAAAVRVWAVLSHLLLDWLGKDSSTPRGLMALWPWTPDYYISDLNVFNAVDRRYAGWRASGAAMQSRLPGKLPSSSRSSSSRRGGRARVIANGRAVESHQYL